MPTQQTHNSKIVSLVALILFLVFSTLNANASPKISIDFGDPNQTTGGNVNNITDFLGGSVQNLIGTDGNSTSINIALTDGFSGMNPNGTNTAEESLEIPGTASIDYFYGSSNIANMLVSGLDSTKAYNLKFFASRMNVSDTVKLVTEYSIIGANNAICSLDMAYFSNYSLGECFSAMGRGIVAYHILL